MAQSSLLGYFEKNFKKKTIVSTRKVNVGKHNKQKSKIRKAEVQQFLQVGQKDTRTSQCDVCGMMYTKGIAEDDKLHRNFHLQFTKSLLVPVCLTVHSFLL